MLIKWWISRGEEQHYASWVDIETETRRTGAGGSFLYTYIHSFPISILLFRFMYRRASPDSLHRDPYNSSGPPGMIHHAEGPTLLLSRRRITPSSRSYGSYKRRMLHVFLFRGCFFFFFFPPFFLISCQNPKCIGHTKRKQKGKRYIFLPQTLRVVGGGLRLGLYKESRPCQRSAALSTERSWREDCRTRCSWRKESRWAFLGRCPAHERRIASTFSRSWAPETSPTPKSQKHTQSI